MHSTNKSNLAPSGRQSTNKSEQGRSVGKSPVQDSREVQTATKKSGTPISPRSSSDLRSPGGGRNIPSINEPLEITAEQRTLYDQFYRSRSPNPAQMRDDHSSHSSTGKGRITPGSGRARTPVQEQREFSFHDSYGKSGQSMGSNRLGESLQKGRQAHGSLEKDRPQSRQSPASRKDSEGKISTHSEHVRGSTPQIRVSGVNQMVPETQEHLDQLLERGDVDISIQITGEDHPRNVAEYDVEHRGHGHIEEEGKGEEEKHGNTVERKEYTVWEDWRILESIDRWKTEKATSKGLFSVSFWEKLSDPITNNKLLDGVRTNESLRDHYKRTLANLPVDDINTIKQFVKDHPEEELKQSFCQYKKEGAIKRLSGISNKPAFASNNLKRKTPYNAPSSHPKAPTAGGSKKKASHHPSKGKVEVTFEQDNESEGNHDDISNFTDTQLQRRTILYPRDDETNQRKQSSAGMMKDFLNQARSKATTITIPKLPRHEMSVTAQQMRGLRGDGKKKSTTFGDEPIITRDLAEIKRLKTSDHYHLRSLLVSDSFREKKHDPQPWDYDESLTICVDKRAKIRLAVFEQPPRDVEKEKAMRKLLQLAREYNMTFDTLMDLFKRVSFDTEDLENYLKNGNEALLWEADQDEDLIAGNKVALRYLNQIKGEERVLKRRAYLLEQYQD